jgi:hypothetical protein
MASSQAACANLFIPILENPDIAATILSCVKPDLNKIATDHLDRGFRIEFWDEPDNVLNDHTPAAGTDADIAIAYYDHQGDLNLWMIEHKLTEAEFTACGGYKSRQRTKDHVCYPASAIVANRGLCYYHSRNRYHYWDITLGEASPFDIDQIRAYKHCPFMGGMNQLWRNLLLATSIERSISPRWPYKKVYFSVVYHPGNHYLVPTMNEFTDLIGNNDRFFSFTSDKLIEKALESDERDISQWVHWYQEMYGL